MWCVLSCINKQIPYCNFQTNLKYDEQIIIIEAEVTYFLDIVLADEQSSFLIQCNLYILTAQGKHEKRSLLAGGLYVQAVMRQVTMRNSVQGKR